MRLRHPSSLLPDSIDLQQPPFCGCGGVPCPGQRSSTNSSPFEPMSKRRRSFPSETRVKRGVRIVGGDKELVEKLGRNDPCPCGSKRRFQEMLPAERAV